MKDFPARNLISLSHSLWIRKMSQSPRSSKEEMKLKTKNGKDKLFGITMHGSNPFSNGGFFACWEIGSLSNCGFWLRFPCFGFDAGFQTPHFLLQNQWNRFQLLHPFHNLHLVTKLASFQKRKGKEIRTKIRMRIRIRMRNLDFFKIGGVD